MGNNYNGPIAPPSSSYGSPSQGPGTSYDPTVLQNSQYNAPSGQLSNGGYVPSLSQYGPPDTSQAPIIHKHVYVHVPPPEPEIIPPSKTFNSPPPQKHYKIVFIKAPTAPAPTAPVIPAIPQNEEKTLVYVLVKKPDDQPEVVIPTQPPTQPSKPEVYFIRYKTQKQEDGGGGYPPSISQTHPATLYGVHSPTPTVTPLSPRPSYSAPASPPGQLHGAPSAPPRQSYGAPSGLPPPTSTSYGAPSSPAVPPSSYGVPN